MNNIVYLEYQNKLSGNIVLNEENHVLNFNNIKITKYDLPVNEIIGKCGLKNMTNKYFHIYNSILENIDEIDLSKIYDAHLKNDMLANKILNIFIDMVIKVIENICFLISPDYFYINFNLGKNNKDIIKIIQRKFLDKKIFLKISNNFGKN